mgnify:CR=1 FL=1
MAAIITPIWDEVYISVYDFDGINSSYGLIATVPDYPRGVVNYIGPNVSRVSVGQLVIFKQGPYVYDGTNTWAVVPQVSILTTFSSE